MKVLALLIVLLAVGHSQGSKLSALRQFAFQGYDKLVIPDVSIKAKFGISLLNLEFCPHKQILTSYAWLKIMWNDNRIGWNPTDWNGIESFNVDANQLWLPDIVPYNGEQIRTNSVTFIDNLPKAIVYSSGDILFVPPLTQRTFCAVKAENLQSDTFNCTITYGSWTYHMGLLDIVPFGDDEPDIKYFTNQNVVISTTSVARVERKFDCCPDIYPSLDFSITFKQTLSYHHKKGKMHSEGSGEED